LFFHPHRKKKKRARILGLKKREAIVLFLLCVKSREGICAWRLKKKKGEEVLSGGDIGPAQGKGGGKKRERCFVHHQREKKEKKDT